MDIQLLTADQAAKGLAGRFQGDGDVDYVLDVPPYTRYTWNGSVLLPRLTMDAVIAGLALQPSLLTLALNRFTSVNQLANASGLSIHANGGLIATVDNVAGTGYISLPFAISSTDQWLFAVQMEAGDPRSTSAQLCNNAADFWSGASLFTGSTALTLAIGGGNFVNQQLSAVGAKVWAVISSDGTRIRSNMFVEGQAWNFKDSFASFQQPIESWSQANGAPSDLGSGNSIWGATNVTRLSRVAISTASRQNRILQVYAQLGSQIPGPQAPAIPYILRATIAGERDAHIMIPANYNTSTPKLVMSHHPNGNPGQLNSYQAQTTHFALMNAGYVVAINTGENGTNFASPTTNNWGGPAGLKYRKALYDYVRTNATRTRAGIYGLGLSMGGVNAFRFADLYPGLTKAIACVSAAVDLSDSFSNRGFSTTIQRAYGDAYVCIQAGTGQSPASSPTFWTPITSGRSAPGDIYYASPYTWQGEYAGATAYVVNDIVIVANALAVGHYSDVDPVRNGARFSSIPCKFWHGSADSTIPLAQSSAMVAALVAAGGSATLVTVPGGTHLDASMYDPAGIVSFFNEAA